jgi:hypothetical protein
MKSKFSSVKDNKTIYKQTSLNKSYIQRICQETRKTRELIYSYLKHNISNEHPHYEHHPQWTSKVFLYSILKRLQNSSITMQVYFPQALTPSEEGGRLSYIA